MQRLPVLVAAIALAATFASADDLPPASLDGLAKGFTQTVRFTYSQTCKQFRADCDKGNGNPLLLDLGSGPEVVVDSAGDFVVASSDGVWIVQPDGTTSKLADIPARACQMPNSMSAVVTEMNVYGFLWNGPLNALFLTTRNEEITYSFTQPNPDYCKGGSYSGGFSAVLRRTVAMIQVDYPASGGNAAFNRREAPEPAEPSLGLAQRLSARTARRQPGYASPGADTR